MRKVLTLLLIVLLLAGASLLLLSRPGVQDALMERIARAHMDPALRADLFKDDALRLVVCGSSSPLPSENRARPCLMVIAGERYYIVDTGPGSWNRLALLRIPAERIGGVLFTHFHSDHIGDLGEFNMQTWVGGRPGPLPVYGPEGVERVVAGFQEAYTLDNGYRTAHHGAALLPPERGLMQAHTLALDANGGMTPVLQDGELQVRVFPVTHKPISPSVGYRFDYKGRSLVISGDTVRDAHLLAAARGVDLLAHEAQNQEMVARMKQIAGSLQRPRLEKVFGDIPDYHTSPVEAAQLANEAGAGLLLFYHLTPPPPNRLAEAVFLRGVDAVRPKGTVLARDGMLIELPTAGGAAQVRQLR